MGRSQEGMDPAFGDLLDEGERLKERIAERFAPAEMAITLFDAERLKAEEGTKAVGGYERARNYLNSCMDSVRQEPRELVVDIRAWMMNVYRRIDKRVLAEQQSFDGFRLQLEKCLRPSTSSVVQRYHQRAIGAIDAVIGWISAAAKVPEEDGEGANDTPSDRAILKIQPDTAFILMWMDKDKPELQDVCEAFKEVFSVFGIEAKRADDVQHQDVITQVILDRIRDAEFLIADLTGERPNVYYEVGYAHAIGKKPILFKKAETQLHFDLAGHNVREYKNLIQLKQGLQNYLEAITSKSPPATA